MPCAVCKLSGHNIRQCQDPSIPFMLIKLRCKNWKSVNTNDVWLTYNWLHTQPVVILRAILIHKYRQSYKTVVKRKLCAIIMELEFKNILWATDAFWRVNLPAYFIQVFPNDNVKETGLLIANILPYQPNANLSGLTNNELIHILMPLIMDHQQAQYNHRSQYRNRIEHIEKTIEPRVEEGPFECSVCYEEVQDAKIIKLGCNHEFCVSCVSTHICKTKTADVLCPLCRGEIKTITICTDGNEAFVNIL
jgi:hypothetical protein